MYGQKRSWDKRIAPVNQTSLFMSSHPVVLVTTAGRVNRKVVPGVAVIATCLDTSYCPPYVSFSTAVYQHSVDGRETGRRRTNTYLNIRQNGLFIVNLPGEEFHKKLDVLARPHLREECYDKIEAAGLTKLEPFALCQHEIYPPLIEECLAYLECETVDIHRPKGSDHYTVTGKVVACAYDVPELDPHYGVPEHDQWDWVRRMLGEKTFHHLGPAGEKGRYLLIRSEALKVPTELRFHLEKVQES